MITSPRTSRRHAAAALLAYLLLALVMTWPLAAGLAHDVPGDLGDSLLNLWILGWGAEKLPQVLTGHLTFGEFWNANIFHPEPLTLALSEHLFGQVLQVMPVYYLTGNLILGYNLLFLSSFALSGLGMYLLVRDILTHNQAPRSGAPAGFCWPAFVAGLVYAFIPLRVAQLAHIQSLSSQWMPFALYGFRRFIVTGQWRALSGGSAALLMQHWSCGYYLIFFAPFAPVFVIHQMWSQGRLFDRRRWAGFAAGAAMVAVGTLPFLLPYLEVRRVHNFGRSLDEVTSYSADVHSYFTAADAMRLWGDVILAFPKAEGELFVGFLPMLLLATGLWAAWRASRPETATPVAGYRRAAAWLLGAVVVLQIAALAAILSNGRLITDILGITIRATSGLRIITNLAVVIALLLATWPRARQRAARLLRSPIVLSAALALAAVWLSLGPIAHTRGRILDGLGLYALLYEHVPGFDGLRVPARYSMIAAVFASVVAGAGAAFLLPRLGGRTVVAVALSALILIEAAFLPMPVNLTWSEGPVVPPPYITPASDAPAVYHVLADMPDDVVVTEFPFGEDAWELRYVYYSTVHWKPIVNGYSGAFPRSHHRHVALFGRVSQHPEEAWQALRATGTTHVIVHEGAMTPADAAAVKQWLDDHFAVEVARFDGDLLYDVTGAWGRRPGA